jgi:mono/diheme cytochrome c family protein
MTKKLALLFSIFSFSFAYAGTMASSPALIAKGKASYATNCAMCHGENGRDAAAFPRPIWGQGQDIKKFQTAKGLFDYLQMLMPFDDPNKINNQQKTSITTFMLFKNGDVAANKSMPVGGDSTQIK